MFQLEKIQVQRVCFIIITLVIFRLCILHTETNRQQDFVQCTGENTQTFDSKIILSSEPCILNHTSSTKTISSIITKEAKLNSHSYRFAGILLLLLIMVLLPKQSLYLLKMIRRQVDSNTDSHKAMILFLHHKDGLKTA